MDETREQDPVLDFRKLQDDFRKALLAHALTATNHNVTAAAKMLGLERTYFYNLIRKYDIALRRT